MNLDLRSRTATALGWAAPAVGALTEWVWPSYNPVVDAALAPLVILLLWIVVMDWAGRRAAIAAVVLYAGLLGATVSVLGPPSGSLVSRNLGCSGSAELLVGLGGIVLLEGLALPPLGFALVLLMASHFHPQVSFVPLLMMTLLRPDSLLGTDRLAHTRGAALRTAGLAALAVLITRLTDVRGVGNDAVVLPLAWWISSWLMAGEVFVPLLGRWILVATLCLVTVADFPAWPAMGVVLLCSRMCARES